MAVLLVTYDLKNPGRNYKPVFDYLQRYTYCKHMESVWLLDTSVGTTTIRDDLMRLVDSNDVLFVTQITNNWVSYNYPCGNWLNAPGRSF